MDRSVSDATYDSSLGATITKELSPPGEVTEGTKMNAPSAAAQHLPGEDAPLLPRRGGPPPTADEALGTARRMARERAQRLNTEPELPEALPFPSETGTTPLMSIRVPRRRQWFAHAKADMEGRTLTDVVNEALDAYGQTPPGSVLTYTPPKKA